MSPVHVVLRPAKSSADPSSLRSLLDLVVDGVNITARAGETQGLTLLAELAHAVAALRRGRTPRATAQLCSAGDTWELGLEADGAEVLLSVFRSGPCPEVAVHERRVGLLDLAQALLVALETSLSSHLPPGHRSVLEAAQAQLIRGDQAAKPLARGLVQDRISVQSGGRLELRADCKFRVGGGVSTAADARIERSDLHGLLLPGDFRLSMGRRSIALVGTQLFLLSERLLWLSEDALDSWQSARPLFRRVELEGVRLGVRRGPGDSPLALTIAILPRDAEKPKQLTLADIDTTDFVEAATHFAESLGERFVLHDPAQKQNLRLSVLVESARILRERLSELRQDDVLTNQERESYRSYGLPQVATARPHPWAHGGKMRFSPRWVAAVPAIDLRSTFLYAEQLIVASARELAALDPATGTVRWRVHSERAATVATPLGLARLHADGRVRLHALENGEVRAVARLEPRAGGGAAGALVNTPGLPRQLLLAEGDRAITALDLATGEVRWRHRASRPAQYRLRRAGRLILVTGGDSALTALDVSTGDVVWRVRDRLPFSGDICVTGDSAFALSVSSTGAARLHHFDLWSGERKWTALIEEQPVFGQAPLVSHGHVVVITRDRRGMGLLAFDQKQGALAYSHEPGLTTAATAWLATEHGLVANSASGTLLCLHGATGEVRYSHIFSRQVDSDQPRRLEPVLAAGALFVPQHVVRVLRPSDGEILGEIPCDLIPDLLRVDERSNVYIAEESGHMAAYSTLPRLQLVR
jgi:outer membrane protein assembly factor BamB